MRNFKVNNFFMLIFSFAVLLNLYFCPAGFSGPDCDNCQLKSLCDETVLDCGLPLCEDEAFRKYFDPSTGKAKDNALELIRAELNLSTAEANLGAVTNEVTVETILKKDSVIN